MDIETFNWHLQLVSAIILIMATTFVLIRLRFHLELSTYVILSLYFLVIALRLIPVQFEREHTVIIIMWPIASNMIWVALFYFVF